jgi:nucleotide-binding universal stress UspA family protein
MSAPILVGYSPQTADRGPINFGVAVSRFTRAPLVVAAVYPGGSDIDMLSGGEFGGDADGDRTGLPQLQSELEAEGVDASVKVVEHSTPARGLAGTVEETDPRLVVIGSTRRGRLGRVLPGSTAERLIHGSPRPVVVVPHGYEVPEQGLQTVGAAFVPTDEGRAALRTAAVIALAAGARVLATMVLSPKHAAEMSPGLMAHAHHEESPAEDLHARHRIEATEELENAITELASDVEVERDVLFQRPAEGLEAASQRVDLLVMGSRAYGPARAVMLGGVSRQVTASASCPVLVLPRGAEDQIDALLATAERRDAPET